MNVHWSLKVLVGNTDYRHFLKTVGGGRALLILGLDRHGAASSRLEPESHHRFVDLAHLLRTKRG
jgi:hypothetical protein